MTSIAILKDEMCRQGGLEKYTRRLADAFVRHGCAVALITSGTAPALLPRGVSCEMVSERRRLSYRTIKAFDKGCMRWLGENPCDIVFGMGRNSFQTHYRAGNGVHAAYLDRRRKSASLFKQLSFAINPLHRTVLSLEKATYESPLLRRLFTNSALVRDEILRYYNTDPSKISVIHNGVEWHEMTDAFTVWPRERNIVMRRLGLDSDAFHFLFVGNGFRRKGLEFLIKALSRIPRRDVILSVVGDDRELDVFKSLAVAYGVGERVRFFGARNDVITFYKIADALVIPSTYDPFANVTVEALAMGLTVVTSKENGGHEVITNDNGIIIDNVYDPDGLIDSLEKALQRPKTYERSLGIRNSIEHLDFSRQLDILVSETLRSS